MGRKWGVAKYFRARGKFEPKEFNKKIFYDKIIVKFIFFFKFDST